MNFYVPIKGKGGTGIAAVVSDLREAPQATWSIC